MSELFISTLPGRWECTSTRTLGVHLHQDAGSAPPPGRWECSHEKDILVQRAEHAVPCFVMSGAGPGPAEIWYAERAALDHHGGVQQCGGLDSRQPGGARDKCDPGAQGDADHRVPGARLLPHSALWHQLSLR
jgi:hypothetical protein